MKKLLFAVLVFALSVAFSNVGQCQDDGAAELELLKSMVGEWEAEFEVWAQGPENQSMKFKGTETIRASGKHWLVSELKSQMMGQVMSVHSMMGYDLDKKKLFGMIVDHGPYSATMTGEYDKEKKTASWTVQAKMPDGTPMIQKTTMIQDSEDKRRLILNIPGPNGGEPTKMMEIRFTKKK